MRFRTFIILLASGVLGGCGSSTSESVESTEPVSATCPSKSVQIGVYDGALVHLCGCSESKGNKAVGGETLVCTAARDSQVTFLFFGRSLDHQIVFTDDRLANSPFWRSDNGSAVKGAVQPPAHSLQFPSTGSFSYRDGGVQGRFVVF